MVITSNNKKTAFNLHFIIIIICICLSRLVPSIIVNSSIKSVQNTELATSMNRDVKTFIQNSRNGSAKFFYTPTVIRRFEH